MIRKLFASIDRMDRKKRTKYTMALWILGISFAAAGLICWCLLPISTLKTIDWMICFAGYPVALSWFVVFGVSCRQPFHEGVYRDSQD